MLIVIPWQLLNCSLPSTLWSPLRLATGESELWTLISVSDCEIDALKREAVRRFLAIESTMYDSANWSDFQLPALLIVNLVALLAWKLVASGFRREWCEKHLISFISSLSATSREVFWKSLIPVAVLRICCTCNCRSGRNCHWAADNSEEKCFGKLRFLRRMDH